MNKIKLKTSRKLNNLMDKLHKNDLLIHFMDNIISMDEISIIYKTIRFANESLKNNKPTYIVETRFGLNFIFVGTYKEIENKLKKVLKMKVFE